LEALDATDKDKDSAVMSVLGKRLLTKSRIAPGKSDEIWEDRKDELRRTIGDKAYQRLEQHDELLEYYSKNLRRANF
jgi:hypothetical protein